MRNHMSRLLTVFLFSVIMAGSLCLNNPVKAAQDGSISAAVLNPQNGNYYQVIDKQLTWEQAEAYCVQIGGHLATITSENEQQFIEALLPTSTSDVFWLGAQKNILGNFEWVITEEFVYSHWAEGEPNNYNGTENSLMMYKNVNFGYWNDLNNTCIFDDPLFWHNFVNMGLICEWEGYQTHPGISISMTGNWIDTNGNGYADAGEAIGYTITVENIGNIDLTGVTVTDAMLNDEAYVSGDIDFDKDLDVDETWTYTGSHTITATDITSGAVNNVVSVDSDQTGPVSASAYTELSPINPPPLAEEWNYYPDQYSKDLALEAAQYCTDIEGRPDNSASIELDLLLDSFDQVFDYNFEQDETGVNKVAYVIANKNVNYHGIQRDLVAVVIRGSHGNEWYGNMQITGTQYESKAGGHINFYLAMNDVYTNLEAYLKNNGIEEPLIFITGHSRGAAVANILADSLDGPNNAPVFNNSEIFAYTFATPNTNLSKYAYDDKNIFNFCFTDDFVTQMPLLGWGWTKNGQTFLANAEELYLNNAQFKQDMDNTTFEDYPNETWQFNSQATANLLSHINYYWKNTKDYYNKDWSKSRPPIYIKLYYFMDEWIAVAGDDGMFMFGSQIGLGSPALIDLKYWGDTDKIYGPIANFFVNGTEKHFIAATHDMHTYTNAIENDCFSPNPYSPSQLPKYGTP